MIEESKIARLRSLVLVSRNPGVVRSETEVRLQHLVVEACSLLGDIAETLALSAPATPPTPPQIRLQKRPPSKPFLEDLEWQHDRGLLLLRHLAARPGSAEVRELVEAYLRDLDLEGKPVPPIGRLPAADPGPKEVPVPNAQPIDVRREGEPLDVAASRSRLRAEAAAEVVSEGGDLAKRGPAGGLVNVPWHSQSAAKEGAAAGRNGDGPEKNPHHGTRGVAGSRRLWWERARQAAKG